MGGEFFETVMFAMNSFGRVSVCGTISTYNVEDPPKGILKIVDIMIILYTLSLKTRKHVGKVQILSRVTEWFDCPFLRV